MSTNFVLKRSTIGLVALLALSVVLMACGDLTPAPTTIPAATVTPVPSTTAAATTAGATGTAGAGSAATPGVTKTASGLQIIETQVGTGAAAQAGSKVSVDYTGKLKDGKVFDTSVKSGGQPISFVLGTGKVIKGWDEGLVGMKVGGKRTLIIPPDLGYGAAGSPPVIPPNAELTFDVELKAVQ